MQDYKKVLITGALGFIGSHLMVRLKECGYDVMGVDNYSNPCGNKVEAEYLDVRHKFGLKKYIQEADIVFHLAAEISVDKSITEPECTVATNILGTQHILELVTKLKKKMVFASTSEVYGSSQKELMSESHPLDPHSPYAASKLAADRMCFAYYKTYGTNVVILRNFNTFGPFQNDKSYGGVIAKFTKAALKGEPLYIYGDGYQFRDYMYITDALSAYGIASRLAAGTVINAGSGRDIMIKDLAEQIIELADSKSKIIHIDPRPGEVNRLCADISKIRQFDFYPRDFNESLKEYICWAKERLSRSSGQVSMNGK